MSDTNQSTQSAFSKWIAFTGWLILPILATWGVVALTGIQVLWWGPVWFCLAVAYMVGYFTWVRRKFAKRSVR